MSADTELDSAGTNGTLWRPQVHFTPPKVSMATITSCSLLTQKLKNWMNDPNGLHVDANGMYHLYYQCQSS